MKKLFVAGLLVIIAGSAVPLLTDASAVWRVEITDYQEPAETTSRWSWLVPWLATRAKPAVGTTFTVSSSAYASSPYQTDSTPCITAAGTRVRPGVVATNFLPLGTILTINGERYIVEDRMNSRFQGYYLDIWFPATSDALEFGRQRLNVEVTGYGTPGQDIRPEADIENTERGESTLDPSLLERLNLRLIAASRVFSKLIATNVNRHDVDCFTDTNVDDQVEE